MRVISLIALCLMLSQGCWAQQCIELFSHKLELPQDRKLTFNNVQVYRRNNNVGLQQVGVIEFQKWIEVGPFAENVYNHVGLTAEGRLYHLVQWKNQRVARLLGGRREFKNFFFLNNEVLAAVDAQNAVFLYAPAKWITSPLKSTLKTGTLITGGFSAALTAAISYFAPEMMTIGFQVGETMVPTAGFAIASVVGMNTFFVMLQRYERLNTFPDGFVKTTLVFKDPETLKNDLLGIDQKALREFFARQALQPPERHQLDPEMPEMATEDIR